MKLNSYKASGWKGRYGWRNAFDIFLSWNSRRKISKAVNVLQQHSTVPFEKSLVVYNPQIRIKPVEIPIPVPQVSLRAFLTLIGVLFVVIVVFLSFVVYVYLRDEYEYREKVRNEIVYNLERYLEPYAARQKELEMKIDSLNEILPLDSEFRRRLILKYTQYDINKPSLERVDKRKKEE